MFFSVDLLGKKSPLGQIWITAVMNAKVTRKKASLIDLSDVCDRIREPEVPIALRLSGILMGGVTRVYQSKVVFLWEDAQCLMARIREGAGDGASSSKGKAEKRATATTDKSRARFDAVTNDYDFNNIDMLPLEDGYAAPEDFLRDFVELPDVPLTDNYASAHRAAREEVTLPDIEPAGPLFDENFDELLPPAADFLMDEENAPLPPDDGPQGPSSPLDGPDAFAADGADHAAGAGRKRAATDDEDGSPAERQRKGQQPKVQRRRRARTSGDALVDEETQLSAAVLQSWLRDPSDIIHSGPRRVQEATPREVLHGLKNVPALYSNIDEGGHITSNLPPAIRDIYWKIANLPRTGGGAEPDGPMGAQEGEDGPGTPRRGSAMSGDSVEHRRREREGTPDFGFDGISPMEGGLFVSDDAPPPRSARSTGTPDSTGSQGANRRNMPLDPSPPLGDVPDLAFGAHMDIVDTVPDSTNLLSMFTEDAEGTLQETSETEHTQRQQQMSKRTARFAQHFEREVFQPGRPTSVTLDSLLSGCKRHQAAVSFAEILALATRGYVRVEQEAPYGPIVICKGNQ